MAAGHLEVCPGCGQRTLYVAQQESKDVGYCQDCGHELVRVLAKPRMTEPVTLSRRPRTPAKDPRKR